MKKELSISNFISDPEEIRLGKFSTTIRRLTLVDRVLTIPAKCVSVIRYGNDTRNKTSSDVYTIGDKKYIYSGDEYFPVEYVSQKLKEKTPFGLYIINLDPRTIHYGRIVDHMNHLSSFTSHNFQLNDYIAGISTSVDINCNGSIIDKCVTTYMSYYTSTDDSDTRRAVEFRVIKEKIKV